jgi:hypothetical protein
MDQQVAASQKTRAEQETENEANRLIEQVQSALASVASHSPDEDDSLQACADRIERAARDFTAALRELAEQRKAEMQD